MIYLKIATIIICAACNSYGGYKNHNFRRFFMPIGIVVAVSLITQSWWTGLPCLLGIAPLTMGYGEKSPLRHIFGDAWGRFVWMVLVSTSFCLGLIIMGYLPLWIALLYIIGNGILGITLRRYNQILIDIFFGITLSSFILFLK